MTTLLLAVPVNWAPLWTTPLSEIAPDLKLAVDTRDAYKPEDIDYVLSFRPAPGFLATLPNLKAVFSLGAGVDGFLADKDYPKNVPLVRFVDHTLSREMAQFVVMHVLIHHRQQRFFDQAQKDAKWRQAIPPRRTEDTRIGILGLGEIGQIAGEHLRDLDFPVSGWSRSRKTVDGIRSYAGASELDAFLASSDILVCLLPLTPDTRGILDKATFAKLPFGAFVINVARGGHLIEPDLIAALDNGHLSGAVLDVFQTEPLPEDSPLWQHPKVTATPHVAAISDPRVAAKYVHDRIVKQQAGEALDNLVDLEKGY
ncbi:MAG TPA: glyoxylate/hydroxypyruvate reductase A [Rhizomicrobium sp.]|jgi:glyoxylate/hydroxypyruvate reductase A|nr:glyoxylate/hydroxypyruvate reductase A [Rhizomicrobium sp.]